MPFSTREQYHAVVVQITGRFLGSIEGPKFKEMLEDLKESGKKHVVIDLSKADFMDSSGIGEIVAAYTTVTNRGGKLRLYGIPPRVSDILQITQLVTVLDILDDEDEAVASFR